MSRYNTSKMLATYTDDFGNEYENIPFKIQLNAPAIDDYAARATGLCAPSRLFTTRRLLATFADGRTLTYPVATEAGVKAKAAALKGAGAVCIDYVGEKWNIILGATVGGDLAYKSDKYTGLTPRKVYEVGSFSYTSQLGLTGLATFRLPVRIPNDGNAALKAAQMACLDDFQAASGICSAGSIITPRYFLIQAKATDADSPKAKTVLRQAKVSLSSNLADCAQEIAPAASCLGYRGESVRNIHALLA